MLRDVPLDRRRAQIRFAPSPHFVIPLCYTLVFPLSSKHVPWVDGSWSRHNVKYDFTSHRWLDEGEPTTGGGKGQCQHGWFWIRRSRRIANTPGGWVLEWNLRSLIFAGSTKAAASSSTSRFAPCFSGTTATLVKAIREELLRGKIESHERHLQEQ